MTADRKRWRMPVRCGWRAAVAALLLVWLPALGEPAAAADPVVANERKAVLVERLLHPRSSPWTPDLPRLLRLMTETPVRRHFRSLSADAEWGPTRPLWRSQFSRFREDYLDFLAPRLASVEARLTASLLEALSEDEMLGLVALIDDPELDQVLQLASRQGLDLDVAVRTANLAAAPELYSPEEVAAIRAELVRLQSRDAVVMGYLAAKMQALGSRFQGPVYARFQAVVAGSLAPLAAAEIDDDGFRAAFAVWLSGWRQRLGFQAGDR